MEEIFISELYEYQLTWIDDPDWHDSRRTHNWRNYVPPVYIIYWDELSRETKIAILIMALRQSDSEE